MPNTVFHPRLCEKNPGLKLGKSWGTHHTALIVASTNPKTTPFAMLPPTVFCHLNRGKSRKQNVSEKAIPVAKWYTLPAQKWASKLCLSPTSRSPLKNGQLRSGNPFPEVKLRP